jgi:amidase
LKKASEGLQSAHFTSVDLVKAYIARIHEVSEFNAVLQINPDAVTDVKNLDEERLRTGSRGYVNFFFFCRPFFLLSR